MDSCQNQASNFNHLAQVCSDIFISLEKDKIDASPTSSETKKSKSTNALDFTRVEDIRSLNTKSLVERYSESTCDELQRRYFFKCILLPEECNLTLKSYGSEKKAYDNMKQHLLTHLDDLEIRIANGMWPPMQENNDSGISSPPDNLERHTKKLKTEHPSGIKMPKQNVNRRTKKQPKKKCDDSSSRKRKSSNEVVSSSVVKTNSKSKSVRRSKENSKPNLKPANQQGFTVDSQEDKKESVIVEEVVQDCTSEMCSPLCVHLNCSRAQPSTSQVKPPIKMSPKEDNILSEVIAKISLLYEHNYASLNGVKFEKANHVPVKNTTFRTRGCCIPPQFIIKTPPFPHVHVPLLPDCSSVEEIGLESTYDQMKTEVTDSSSATLEPNSPPGKESKTFVLKSKRLSKKSRKKNVSNSVLECVENRVDVIASSVHVPNDISSSDDNNTENSENVQKAERDLALKYIAKLKSKKNKQYQGPLECKICKDKQFTAQATLIHHYRSHAGIKPFACKVCCNTFTRQHSLKYHMLIHNGLSRFTCEFCRRKFRHPSHFKEHLRRHTGETPFGCPNCPLKFKTRNTYKRHLKMQHKKLLVSRNIIDLPSD